MNSFAALSITALGKRIRENETTSEAITADCLERIAEGNAQLNAFITVLGDQALADARDADREIRGGRDRGPLHGIPISLKDLIDLAGTPTTAASRVRQGSIARHDALVVTHLKSAGAVLIGKCNLHEFAYGTTSDDSAFGPVRHPLDPTRVAGGSSGGSAVAVATGMSVASVGTDTGGSIRIPSALCGVVGLKPSHHEVSCAGVVPLSWSLDQVGPITRCVDDARLLFEVMRGKSAPLLHDGPARLRGRLGVPRSYFLDVLDNDVRTQFEDAIRRLQTAGATIDDVWIPHAADTPAVYLHIQAPEAAAYHAPAIERHPEAYSPAVRLRLEAGRYLLAEDYVRAQRGRDVLRREVDAALEGHAALVLPTVAIPPPPIGAAEVEVSGSKEAVRGLMLRLTQLFNLTGHPVISIPSGAHAQGFPSGVQLIGPAGGTERLLELARACEQQLR